VCLHPIVCAVNLWCQTAQRGSAITSPNVVATPILRGLHHEYRVAREAA
jgi:hypothetical protein